MSRALVPLVLAAALGACTTSNPDVVRRYETQRLSQVWDATVLSVRPVTVEGSQSGVGVGAGAVAGGVAGSNVGQGSGSVVGAVVGAVVGGVIGNAVERGATRENAVEIIVQLRNGERRAIVQGAGGETFAPGDAVILVSSGARTRIAHAPQVGAPPPVYAPPAGAAVPSPAQPVPVYPQPVPPRS